MGVGNPRFTIEWSARRLPGSSSNFVRLEHLRKLRGSEQVGAVCYRIGKSGIEFLLVRTRAGRWIFPKGSVESGLTHAQSAALEAFEEAGVHGRIEESAFVRYIRVKPGCNQHSSEIEIVINAHLCEVFRLAAPKEANRNPTWFSAEKAKRRLREDRATDYGDDLAQIVDRAVARIQRLYRAAQRTTEPIRTAEIIEIGNPRLISGKTKALGNGKTTRRGSP
jgi:8-oxo-dGTP pyrophosphatase MutT (NUDIX family)